MFPNSIAAFGQGVDAPVSRDQYAADFQQQTNNLNTMLQMLRCTAYSTIQQSIPTAVDTILVFNTDLISIPPTPAIHFPSLFIVGSKFVAPANGFYYVLGQVDLGANDAGNIRQISIRVNGVVPTFGTAAFSVKPNAVVNRLQVSMLVTLHYTDYVQFSVYQDSGGPLNTELATTWGSVVLLSRL